jgi:hypothetical protein
MATHNEMFDNPVETATAATQMLASLNKEEVPIVVLPESRELAARERIRVRVARFMARILSRNREEIGA